MRSLLFPVRHTINLIAYKTYADLRAEAARGYIGLLWWVVEPVLYLAVFYLVFGIFFQRGEPGFVVFLLCGLIVWKWFASSIQQGASSILESTNLIRQIYLPKHIFPLVVVSTNSVKFLIVYSVFLLLLLYAQTPNTDYWSLSPLVILVQLLLHIALATLLAAIVPFIPDLRNIISNVLMLMMFVSGIFFDPEIVPEGLRDYFFLNPVAVLIDSYRQILLYGAQPDLYRLLMVAIFSVLGVLLAGVLLRRFDYAYPKASLA